MSVGPWAAYALGKPGAWADQPWEGNHVPLREASDTSYALVVAKLPKSRRPAPPT